MDCRSGERKNVKSPFSGLGVFLSGGKGLEKGFLRIHL